MGPAERARGFVRRVCAGRADGGRRPGQVVRFESGWDIPGRARELAAHFAEQGSPIMVGGGLLAYTMLGVAFDQRTGEAAFLILDPHYTGGEDIKAIQPRWCGWKKAEEVFARDAFYNLLLPQRPREV